MKKKGNKVNSYGLVHFRCQVPGKNIQRLSKKYKSFQQILNQIHVEINQASKLFSAKEWQNSFETSEHKNSNFFSLAKEIRSQSLTIRSLFRSSLLKEIVQVKWPNLQILSIPSCKITNVESLILLDAKNLYTLNLQDNQFYSIRSLIKLTISWRLFELRLSNKILNTNALKDISHMSLQNIQKFSGLQEYYSYFERSSSYTQKLVDSHFLVKNNINLNYSRSHDVFVRVCPIPSRLLMLLDLKGYKQQKQEQKKQQRMKIWKRLQQQGCYPNCDQMDDGCWNCLKKYRIYLIKQEEQEEERAKVDNYQYNLKPKTYYAYK